MNVSGTGRQRARSLAIVVVAAVAFATTACESTTAGAGSPASIITVSATVTVTATVTVQGGSPAATSQAAQPSGITPRQAQPDPCKLLTLAEASTLAGMQLQAGVGAGAEQGVNTLCEWTRDPNASGTGQVSILAGDGAKKALDIDKDTLKHKFTKVSGIGDECWQEDGGIWVRKGTVWVSIGLVLLDDPAADVTPMRQAAKLVASRF